MKLIQEIQNTMLQLTDIQKYILIVVGLSPTSETAYENTEGDIGLVTSRNLLQKFGYITLTETQCMLTNLGNEALRSFNLLDDSGQITETGRKISDEYNYRYNKDNQNGDASSQDFNMLKAF